MDTYGEAVKKIDKATADAQSILDQMNAQSLVLAQVATQYGVATNHGQNPDAATAAALRAQGFDFYDWAPGEIRLVTAWDTDEADAIALATAIGAL